MAAVDDLLTDLAELLASTPVSSTREGREALFSRVPASLIQLLPGHSDPFVHYVHSLRALQALGRLDDGSRPVMMVVDVAMRRLAGSEAKERLRGLAKELESHYSSEPLTSIAVGERDLEALLFDSDVRVPFDFIKQAQTACAAVARVEVTVSGGRQYGTGWLITPTLMLTNQHVVAARSHASTAAASSIRLWFDYHDEGGARHEAECAAIEFEAPRPDVAALRLSRDTARPPLQLAQGSARTRANIVQYPGGGPLRIALRRNAVLTSDEARLQYLTDTEPGSSGSPLCDDDWRVFGMHARAGKAGKPRREDLVGNEGIPIAAILDAMPAAIRSEIRDCQGRT